MKENYENLDVYIADLQAEINQNENCANHYYNLGMAFLSKGDFMAAEDAFLAALRNAPRLAEAYVQLGGICLSRNDLDGCLRYNEEAAQCRAKFPVPWSNIGFVYLQQGLPEKALPVLKKALAWDPHFIQAMASLGTAYYMLGEYDESLAVSAKAVELEPGFGPAWNNLSLAWFEKGDTRKALECVAKARECGYDTPTAYLKELGIAD